MAQKNPKESGRIQRTPKESKRIQKKKMNLRHITRTRKTSDIHNHMRRKRVAQKNQSEVRRTQSIRDKSMQRTQSRSKTCRVCPRLATDRVVVLVVFVRTMVEPIFAP